MRVTHLALGVLVCPSVGAQQDDDQVARIRVVQFLDELQQVRLYVAG
jgi:hypothetical protein